MPASAITDSRPKPTIAFITLAIELREPPSLAGSSEGAACGFASFDRKSMPRESQ